MKLGFVFLISFFSIAVLAQEGAQNWAAKLESQGSACSVEPVIISCVKGGEAAAPGCAISCRENQIAKCEQGQVLAYSCRGFPATCSCN